MHPIVDGLEADYGAAVRFVRLDANGDGQTAFDASGLAGHPSYLLLGPDGAELWRGFGLLPAENLVTTLERILSS